MKIVYCRQQALDEIANRKLSISETQCSKTKISEPDSIIKNDFQIISNITELEYEEKPGFAEMYDKIMSKDVFFLNYQNFSHFDIFQEYKNLNMKIAKEINDIYDEEELVVNDSSLLLLPSLVKCRVAIRNLLFDHTFIERLPFYSEIILSLFQAQKFFRSIEAMKSFQHYALISFEFKDMNIGGTWYISSYVDRFLVLDVLEHFEFIINNPGNDKVLDKKRFNSRLLSQIKELDMPKKRKTILVSSNPSYLESFMKNNPNIDIRYLKYTEKSIDSETLITLENLKRLYCKNFKIIDTDKYSNVIVEMIYCDVYIGKQYQELAKVFRRGIVECHLDSELLANSIRKALETEDLDFKEIFGEEEYIREFMKINGYEIILASDPKEDEAIRNLHIKIDAAINNYQSNNILRKQNHEYNGEQINNKQAVLYYKINEESNDRVFYRRKDDFEPVRIGNTPKTENNIRHVEGQNPYSEANRIQFPRQLIKYDFSDLSKVKKLNRISLLLDYDGTLVEIVEDHRKASPTPELLEILNNLQKNVHINLAICSGRSKKILDDWIPKDIEVYAEHGAFHRVKGKWESLCSSASLEASKEIMEYYQRRTPNSEIELKETAIVFHYRKVKDFDVSKLYNLLRQVAGTQVSLGKSIVEIKLSKKCTVARRISPDIVIGDDLTDEDMFKVCKGLKLKVGEGFSYADAYLEDVNEVYKLLRDIVKR